MHLTHPVTSMYFYRDDPEAQAESEGWTDWHRDYLPPNEIAFEPVMDVLYPIIDDISRVDVSRSGNSTSSDKSVVGLLAVIVYWREFIRDILPPGSNGIVVVIRNPCTEPFTYQINGPDIEYLGVGDKHDAKYNSLVIESMVVDVKSFSLRSTGYTGAPIDREFCQHSIHVYPSDRMKSHFTTQNALIFMISTLLIFAFTSLVFVLYDWRVEHRQRKVMSAAVNSSAIVSSLFPSTVRDQLYPTPHPRDSRSTQPPGQRVRNHSHFHTELSSTLSPDIEQIPMALAANPNAQLYPDTTVIFADIVGFTQWSSIRQPTEVFHLLEVVYAGFDALAKIYGVFKIETIGDSYVAVVGLPNSRKRHAVVMAKFANDCRTKFTEMTRELAELLGPVRLSCNLCWTNVN
jgi:Adenylate and Guanylate cyclase catalytic domain